MPLAGGYEMRKAPLSGLLLAAAYLSACNSRSSLSIDQSGPRQARLSTNDVFRALVPTCEGCHGAGSSIPSFSSLAAFENLVVYNPDIVTVGSPDASELVRLLEGTSSTGRQMPPNIRFSDLASRGQTGLTMVQIRGWISALEPTSGDRVTAARDAVTLRRKTAEQAMETLADQLGLTENDFFRGAGGTPNEPYLRALDPDNYPVRSPDATGIITDYSEGLAHQLFISLGGPNLLKNRKRNKDLNPVFLQTWIALSQAWCRTSVEKQNSVLFQEASLDDSSDTPTGRERIRNNISYLYLRMLGDDPTEQEADELLNNIFLHYLPPTGQPPSERNKVPWTAVCAALAQDPLWLTY